MAQPNLQELGFKTAEAYENFLNQFENLFLYLQAMRSSPHCACETYRQLTEDALLAMNLACSILHSFSLLLDYHSPLNALIVPREDGQNNSESTNSTPSIGKTDVWERKRNAPDSGANWN